MDKKTVFELLKKGVVEKFLDVTDKAVKTMVDKKSAASEKLNTKAIN